MALTLANFPLGTVYYFCHAGATNAFPSGGAISARGQVTMTRFNASFTGGLCAGEGNTWIGLQASDGRDYFSNQVNLHYAQPTVAASNNNGQMAVKLADFPLGVTYYFCHSGATNAYPTGGSVFARGQFNVTGPSVVVNAGLCAGSGNSWIGLQAPDGRDYYSNQVNLNYAPPSVTVTNNAGQMGISLSSFPVGTAYYFCHSGATNTYPTGGVVTAHGQVSVTSASQSWGSGLCSGRGNAWIGLQAPDGRDYYSNQVELVAPPTPGASVTAGNNNGQMAVQLHGFPLGVTYYFCHSGNPDQYPTGGVITGHGQWTVGSPNQSWSSGVCSGRGNAWIGLQASDGADYYSNQIDLYAPPTAGADVHATSSGGGLYVQFSQFPTGLTYYFCHTGAASQYPTGGAVPTRGQLTLGSPNQTVGPLCSGSGNFWVGFQATDGHDYYTNQVTL
jgi:YHS domain-containing protein